MVCLYHDRLGILFFIREKLPIEVTSVILLTMLLLFGQVFPVLDANGNNLLNSMTLLAGFANPALVAVLGLLVMGQAIVQTDALRPITQIFLRADPKWAWVSMFGILFMVMALSAFMNNTPLVILAIPILQALTNAVSVSESRIMIPLSFAAILGGMTTLVGSSTNMLVSGAMVDLGYNGFGFFDFVVPGSVMASIGFLYVLLVLPRMMPDRRSFRDELVGEEKEFIAELDVSKGSKLIGQECVNGTFPSLETMKIRLIQRSGHLVCRRLRGTSFRAIF